MPRIIYMGTPAFACPALAALAERPGVEVSLVVTQPDRPAGRGRRLQESPVKALADALGLPTYQPVRLRDAESRHPFAALQPDLIVVAAYGLILGRSVLELPARGCVNLHASLLPEYRGASPVSAAILRGDDETGVTLMRMERGLDTGPMFASARTTIAADDTTESLTERLSFVARDLLLNNLDALLARSIDTQPQGAAASLTRPLVKADGWIDWSAPAAHIERHVRAMWPWPRAWTIVPNGSTMQIHAASVVDEGGLGEPGTVAAERLKLRIRCGTGWLQVERGQLAGGRPMDGRELVANRALATGALLGGRTPTKPGPLLTRVDS